MNNQDKKVIEVENAHHMGDQFINFMFFTQIKDFLEKETDVEKTRRIVHMSRDEFAKLFSDLSSDKLYTAYANRLLEL